MINAIINVLLNLKAFSKQLVNNSTISSAIININYSKTLEYNTYK